MSLSYNFETYEYENGMRKPHISLNVEKEHIFLCSTIKRLESDLENAKRQMRGLQKKRMDREYIDHNVACAKEWIHYSPELQHPWKTHKNIIANLKGLLDSMNTCSCCSRHMMNRPTCDDICREVVYPPSSLHDMKNLENLLAICDCQCRQTARVLQKRLYELNEEHTETSDDDSLY